MKDTRGPGSGAGTFLRPRPPRTAAPLRSPALRPAAWVSRRAHRPVPASARTRYMVCSDLRLARRIAIIDPGVHDHPRPRVGPEEQSEAVAAELGPEPVPASPPQSVAIPGFGNQRVARGMVQHQILQSRWLEGVGLPLWQRRGQFDADKASGAQ